MLDALSDLEAETRHVVETMGSAITWLGRLREFPAPAPFDWDATPPIEADPVKRMRVIEQRQVDAGTTSPVHARLSNIRDRHFYSVVDWYEHLFRAQALIRTITKWTNDPRVPEIDRWSAHLREELDALESVIHPCIFPEIDGEAIKALKTAGAKVSARIVELKRIGPEQPVEPLTPMAAVEALDARPSWFLNKLPDGVTLDVLRVLDADGYIEVRHVYPKNQATFRGDPTPPLVLRSEWCSPTRIPDNMGTWAKIFKRMEEQPEELPPELRVTDKARAELARCRLPVQDQLPSASPSNSSPPRVVIVPDPWRDPRRSVEERIRALMSHAAGQGRVTRPTCREVADAIGASASSVTPTQAWQDWGRPGVAAKEVPAEGERQERASNRIEAERIRQNDGDD